LRVPPADVRRTVPTAACEAFGAVSETDAAEARSPVCWLGEDDGAVGDVPAPPPLGVVGVAPLLVGVSVGAVFG
jgi:hypothetical protein